jgi:23S rRNA (uridine2552-2'-O)-methyltransferase
MTGKSPQDRLKVRIKSPAKRTESSRRWLERQLNDPYVHKAKLEGFRSRAAFKLQEIDDKYKILKPGQKIVDLGASPGGWTQICVNRIHSQTNSQSRVIGVDLTEMQDIPGSILLQGDFTLEDTQHQIIRFLEGRAHVILSDMAAPACGIPKVDHMRIMGLLEEAFVFASKILAPEGTFVAKVLRGGTETSLLQPLKTAFRKVTHFKPPASRQDSAEMYVIALGFRGHPDLLSLTR